MYTNENIKKFYNNRKLSKVAIERLFDQNKDDLGFVYFTYKIIDKTNGFEYIGKRKSCSFKKFQKYVTCGSIIKHQINEKGISKFEQHILEFHKDHESLNNKEAELVTPSYINDTKTYNINQGGIASFSGLTFMFHCPKTQQSFRGLEESKTNMMNLGFELGMSPKDKDSTQWSEKKKHARRLLRCTEMFFDDALGNSKFAKIKNEDVVAYLKLGWKVRSSKLWLHIPGETIYKRGINFKQVITSSNDNILKNIDQGFAVGKVPVMEGYVIDKSFKFRKK